MHQTIRGYIVRDQLTDRDIVAGREAWWVDIAGPHLAEEIDEQAWVAERCLTKPQGEIRNPTESTCDRANGWMASSWSETDYAEMAQGKAGAIAEGAKSIDPERAARLFREVMSYMSAPVPKATRRDPWDLRGDRVVVPEPPKPTTPEPSAPPAEIILAAFDAMEAKTDALIAKVDAFIVGVQEEIAALPPEEPVVIGFEDVGFSCPFCAKEKPCAVHGTLGDLQWAPFPDLGVEVLHCECCGAQIVERPLSDARRTTFLAEVAVEVDPEIALQAADDAKEATVADLLASSYSRPSWVTDTEEDEDEENKEPPKPLVRKPTEPPFRPKYDEWGFPIKQPPATPTDPAPGSEPPQPEGEPVPEEPGASPPPDQLGTDGSAATAAKGTGSSSHYESIESSLRDATIQEKGMKTRVQLTTYIGGDYVKGQSDDFRVPDITAAAVCAVLSVIKRIADERHQAAIGAGTARPKGGRRIRIQMTEYATDGGEYLKGKPENLSVPDMDVKQVAELVDHQLAAHFGVRRGDAGALVRAWWEFTRETVEGSAGPASGDVPKDERGASDSTAGNLGNTVQGGGAVLDGYGDATRESLALLLPDLLGKTYSKRLHLGLCAVVVEPSLRVISLWEREGDAKLAAKRAGAGARVVDAQGFLIPKAEVEATPEVAPDEVRP